jgi:cobyrinic acid a,c-diamide synthase
MKNSASFARIMIAGTGSGCGKTTVTCGVLKAFVNKGLNVAPFKCGPDFIDPMFHSEITGVKSRNLDMFLCGEETVKFLFAKNSETADISVIEGVMGFYDGLGAKTARYSSCDLAGSTVTPVLLVVNCDGMSLSAAAMVKGYLDFMPNTVKGVILNGVSFSMYPVYKELIETYTDVKVMGFLPKMPDAAIESRHLGLVTAAEISGLHEKIDLIAENAQKYIDLDGILKIATEAPPLYFDDIQIKKQGNARIAIARDNAFCFYYQDSLELLEKLGAQLVPFSPLNDACLPDDIDGLLLGGGYPELYAEALSANTQMQSSIKTAIEGDLPTIAECGGFMYLHEKLCDINNKSFKMVGVIQGETRLTKKLNHFGYIKLTALDDNLLCKTGEYIHAHEFHYSDSDSCGVSFEAQKPISGVTWNAVHTNDTLFAGYPHIHLWGNLNFAKNFMSKCIEKRAGKCL